MGRLAALVIFREVATPLTTASITGHTKGPLYGLDVTPKRVLSDAASPGIPGALSAGSSAPPASTPKVFMHLRGFT